MRFLLKKIIRFILVVLAVTLITFLMLSVLPGDIAHVIAGPDAPPEDIEAIRKHLGLDHNIIVRYFIWLGNALRGELGVSYLTTEPVLDAIVSRLPVTIELLVISQCIALILALPAGIVCAYKSNTIPDRLISGIGFATFSTPFF